ncbi:MAG TPA: YceI family protein [Polyangiaceae bacterium]|nr:YceI family protein [Polyangiaceae bacterium]
MLSLFACNTDPAKDKAKATVAEAVSVAPPTPAASGSASAVTGDVYEFSQDGSKVDFVGAKVTAKEAGSFKTFSGKIVSADGRPENANVTVEIDIASLTVPEAKLVNHLKSPDFFDAEKFPKAVFVSTSIKPGGEKGATHTVSGNLTLHGVTKSIAFPATLSLSPAAAHASAEFAINRKDFGIVYPGAPDDLVKDDVLIQLTILAKKAS